MTSTRNRWKLVGQLLIVMVLVATGLVTSPIRTSIHIADAAPNAQGSGDESLPPLSAEVIAHAQTLYQSGLAQGNDPNSFILIGDSNNEKPHFLRAFSYGDYNLGPYSYLQSVVDAYNTTGAFGAQYPSSEHGMTLNMLMDPLFVNPSVCPDAANLLDCAIQVYKPSVAIVYMGTYDTCNTPFDTYLTNFRSAMDLLTERGVIAIMTTYTVALDEGCWASTPAYTGVIRDMAAQYQMPLLDLPDYVKPLPDQGMEPDGWHLSYPNDYHISFAGDQLVYGNTQRELLTMQMLYMVRRDVMGL
ncbi:SGNH/GDSL hydrolase family protein [Aggregatilinea lenta]|uniref:SGNH/GDSL hydrolase family protein n=1 Tax=Aggregatilinea lenta TaxID=913108 RepID=UPI000E5C13BA|nr:SGNH/GDSL hydrolase family protein [Aggregatilinea lenta]